MLNILPQHILFIIFFVIYRLFIQYHNVIEHLLLASKYRSNRLQKMRFRILMCQHRCALHTSYIILQSTFCMCAYVQNPVQGLTLSKPPNLSGVLIYSLSLHSLTTFYGFNTALLTIHLEKHLFFNDFAPVSHQTKNSSNSLLMGL